MPSNSAAARNRLQSWPRDYFLVYKERAPFQQPTAWRAIPGARGCTRSPD